MSFWDKAINGQQPLQPAAAPAPRQQQPWWAPAAPPSQPPAQQQAPHPNQGLAVDSYRTRQDDGSAVEILDRGYYSKPPQWVAAQPTDRCPNCGSADYAQISGNGKDGQYGGMITIGGNGTPMQSFAFKRCFNCGHSSHRELSDAQNFNRLNAGSGTRVATRQTDTGGAVQNNWSPGGKIEVFGTI